LGATSITEIEIEITKQYRQEAAEALGLHPSATMEEINEEFMRQQSRTSTSGNYRTLTAED
jgi:hypothetical protein